MPFFSRLGLIAGAAAILSGCCYIIPGWSGCSTVAFDFVFINNRVNFCIPEIPVAWELEYIDINGNVTTLTGQGVGGAGPTTMSIADASGFGNSYARKVIVLVNTTCDANTTVDLWTRLEFNGVISNSGTVAITVGADNSVTADVTENVIVATTRNAFSKATGVTLGGDATQAGKSVASASPKRESLGAEKAKKSCCW